MSGETETDVSGWTVDTLHSHMIRALAGQRDLMDERDLRYQQRYDASQRALEAALASADRATNAALLAAKEAVTKAELSADKRFELLNELRSGVATVDRIEALEKVVDVLTTRVDVSEGLASGREKSVKGLYAALGAVVAIISIIVVVANLLT